MNWTTSRLVNVSNNTGCREDGEVDVGVAAYRVIGLVTGSLSLFGTLFILVSFIMFRNLRQSMGFRLIFALAIANHVSAIQCIMQSSNEHCENNVCIAAAYMAQFGNLAGVLWVCFIGMNFFMAISGFNNTPSAIKLNKYKEYIFHSLAWGIPLLFTIIGAAVPYFGIAGMWCWIKSEYLVARFFCYDMWIILVYLWSTFLLIWLCLKRRLVKEVPGVARRLIYYVVVFYICNIFTLIGTFSFWTNGAGSEGWLSITIALFEPLHGFLNALVYGLNVKVIEAWKGVGNKKRYMVDKIKMRSIKTEARSDPHHELVEEHDIGDSQSVRTG
jgi:hypothetical protein